MKPAALFSAVLFGAASLAAQSTTAPSTSQSGPAQITPREVGLGPPQQTVTLYNSATQQTTTITVPAQPSACPVALQARQSPGFTTMRVGNAPARGPAQYLHLTLLHQDTNPAVRATVIVRGLTPKPRATPTPLSLGPDRSDASRTLQVALLADADQSVSADLRVPDLSAVYDLDLVSLTYADGSAWTPAAGKSCRTPIDGFLLVGAR